MVGQGLDARLLELVMRQMLVIAIDPNLPLLEFAHDALLVLGCDSRDVRFGAGVLNTDHITVLGPHLLQYTCQLGVPLLACWARVEASRHCL